MQASLQRANEAADGAFIVATADDVGMATQLMRSCASLALFAAASASRTATLLLRARKRILTARRAPECAVAGAALAPDLGVCSCPEGATIAWTSLGTETHGYVQGVVSALARAPMLWNAWIRHTNARALSMRRGAARRFVSYTEPAAAMLARSQQLLR